MKVLVSFILYFWTLTVHAGCFDAIHFWTRPYSRVHTEATLSALGTPENIFKHGDKAIRKELECLDDQTFNKVLDDLVNEWLTERKNIPGLALVESKLENHNSFKKLYLQAVSILRRENPSTSDIDLNHTIKNVRSLYLMNKELLEDYMDSPKLFQKLYEPYVVGIHETLILDEMLRRLNKGVWDNLFQVSPGIRIFPEHQFWRPLEP